MQHVATLDRLPAPDAVRLSLDRMREDGRILGAVSNGERVAVWGPAGEHRTLLALLAALPWTPSHVWSGPSEAPARPASGPQEARSPADGTQTPPAPVSASSGPPRVKPGSRTAQALALVAAGATPNAAAAHLGISASAVYRAQQRGAKPVCSCCGRPM